MRGGARKPTIWAASMVAAVGLATLSMTVVLAHWTSRTELTLSVTTGNVETAIAGDLVFDFPACVPGSLSKVCDKFDSNVIGTAPLARTADGTTFTITGWVHKGSEQQQFVGFYYTITGDSVEIDVKAGQNHDQTTLGPGNGYWLNPACTGDPGPGGSVACSPKNTRAISNIGFCLVSSTTRPCPPITQIVRASNVGSIPQSLEVSLIGTGPTDADYCRGFHLTIERNPRGSPDGTMFDGSLCDLTGSQTQLATQIDPGTSFDYDLTLSLSDPTSAFNGTGGTFDARFRATQWTAPGAWTDLVEHPIKIAVGEATATAVRSVSLFPPTWVTIDGDTVEIKAVASLPAVIDVFDGSTVTITSWIKDASDPSTTIGFDFTVTGDPVYVEVVQGAASWVDERWASEGQHTWRDPYRSGAAPVSPIASIKFGLVPIPADQPATEDPDDRPSAVVPPAEPPSDFDPTPVEPPVEEPPVQLPPPPDPVSLGGIVWLDEDGDGIRGGGEVGMAGVVVRILQEDVEIARTTTGFDGSYAFSDLEEADYTVLIEAAEGFVFTTPGQGGNPALDSDVTVVDPPGDPLLGRVLISLGASDSTSADSGLVVRTPAAGDG